MTQPPASILESISIASPCHADWEAMTGDERSRFCGECQLNVYNLSGMSRPEAEALIQTTEGRLCVRYFQRADGTIITQDCPVGLQALHKRKLKRFGKIAAAVTLMTVVGSFCVSMADPNDAQNHNDTQNRWLTGAPAPMEGLTPKNDAENHMIMGDVATPPVEPVQGNMVIQEPQPVKPTADPNGREKMGEITAPQPNVHIMGGLTPLPPSTTPKEAPKKTKKSKTMKPCEIKGQTSQSTTPANTQHDPDLIKMGKISAPKEITPAPSPNPPRQ